MNTNDDTELLFILLTLLQFDSYHTKFLGDFDRMFIQKKRGAILNGRDYQLPQELEEKLKTKNEYIVKTNWESPF